MNVLTNPINRACLVLVALAVVPTGQARAAVYLEVGDAGDLPGSSQPTGTGPLSAIRGTLTSGSDDIDMFAITIPDLSLFSATTVSTATELLDTDLFLFDANGMGAGANGDMGAPPQPTNAAIPAGTLSGPAGLYYLAVAEFTDKPISALGDIFPDLLANSSSGEVVGPTGPGGSEPIIGWDVDSDPTPKEAYEILLEGAEGSPIPEPASFLVWGLIGLSFAGVLRLRRCQQR